MLPWGIVALFGLVLGAVTFAVMPGKVRGGILLTMLVGAAGALVATFIGREIGYAVLGRPSLLIALAGTGLVLAVWRWIMGRGMNEPS